MQKQKGISSLVGIIIVVVVAVILFGGVFAYQYFVSKTENITQVQSNQQIQTRTEIILPVFENYKVEISQGMSPNFAGHYVFSSYAGGDGLAVKIKDLETGKEYSPSELFINASFDFQTDSNLIIVHPQIGDNNNQLKYYKWENNKAHFIK
ncbi:MAG: hypothetical protein A2528_03125 [Candidatus Staskawiczbacteria bacterium RIFOXYD2_FULL_37_9]|uniref:Uncharacterized protein n=1 Tax=Candidatus Staskawiczbacteria bacterium RIFOXYB1_FULL_37_44 TaxID=1802223 RepID=A0A1G2IVW6_9BACT|nr:MAG: hypothetical protein A2358_03550 [Candidatus Staskawiczbacteria bacterium RIFOXYB1_FULL_37_44]OGZ83451.1 MAG: hypothetical protein A2416_00810 [Candidatus Staskawiczbacteria bacterium RIFOXYC1_FULL_37_52]OGZ87379.1 MAG: hypothetical protein A2444_00230 [Candidatus Staskawiczbacteria bacterium RIFOXYC2_FULL_37_19]OGZ88895.1 MAG: hypothetical protein A2581_00120 [Candidatus Staskawiczbacteria bacterium RIFOXYD1_FULL_37_110]OGZ93246.1 MAG: hypothetical protein A2528_03125 [Candidatus Stask